MVGDTSDRETMSPATLERVATRFKLLAEPMRLRILEWLRRNEDAPVGEIAAALEAGQQNVSKHLAILHTGGVLSRRKQGNQVRYSVSDPLVLELCDLVCGAVEPSPTEIPYPRREGAPR